MRREPFDQGQHFQALPKHGQVLPIRLGETVTDSQEVLRLNGDRPARLISVTSLGGRPTLQQIGVKVVGPGRTWLRDPSFNRFPPRRDAYGTPMRLLNDVTIRPRQHTRMDYGFQLVIGYRFTSEQRAVRHGLLVRYEIDGQKYEQTLQSAVAACPRSVPQPRCGVWAQGVIG